MRQCLSKSWTSRLRRYVKQILFMVYFSLLVFAFFNYRSHCVETMPNMLIEMARLDNSDEGRCKLDFEKLGDAEVDIFGEPSEQSIIEANPEVQKGGKWSPSDCRSWQRVAIIIPYRDRLHHLHILLRRLHPMLQTQKIDYRIFLIEQAGTDKFNRGKLMNVGYLEAFHQGDFDCLVFQDVDLLPEDDRNLYLCDGYARHLASAIDEMRYHVMYYNYAGGVIAMNKQNFRRINGYANSYWGWGNEDDDFSARIQESGLLLTRPPPHIGRFKMVRHAKETRSEHGNEMFLGWKARWPHDGLNSLNYSVVHVREKPLYTQILVDIGHPPSSMDVYMTDHSKDVSLWWFLKYYFP
ncbi:beta-1,4-galactosyltransferase 1 [Aplysia californica]|uniref:Beta-1,4-galactosyltransferase n=1 Tax=Aplysia californica TaxID=6500 RepID=A0ABM0JN31_APLCA|nr:beta-1,4-galactosyltransferase 1 [Aplysia californica]XP_005097539.1 beta-1,4-galactosyltransferase 1 [Aplysia californica]